VSETHRTGPVEAAGYALAAAVLVIGGALLTTPVLNWVIGPLIVVVCVAVVGRVCDACRGRAATEGAAGAAERRLP
jgi:hypothetical protein